MVFKQYLYIFKKDKLIGFASKTVSKGINILNQKSDNFQIETILNDKKVVFRFKDIKVKKEVSFDDKITFKFKVIGESEIEETNGNFNISKGKDIKLLKESLDKKLMEILTETINYSKETKADFLGLGNYIYLNHYKNNPLTVFLLAVIICSFVEYLISYIMEKLFSARWWDYSHRKFNINGRVCLTNAFLFGVLGVILVYIANPFFTEILSKVNKNTLTIIGIILIILFVSDLITSLIVTFNLKSKIKKLNIDVTEELNKKIKELLETKVLNRRILKAYPKYRVNIIKKYSKTKHEKLKDKIEKVKDKLKNS